jgi:hypothetical protein
MGTMGTSTGFVEPRSYAQRLFVVLAVIALLATHLVAFTATPASAGAHDHTAAGKGSENSEDNTCKKAGFPSNINGNVDESETWGEISGHNTKQARVTVNEGYVVDICIKTGQGTSDGPGVYQYLSVKEGTHDLPNATLLSEPISYDWGDDAPDSYANGISHVSWRIVEEPGTELTIDVAPVLECVANNDDGSYTAHLGYDNRGDADVTIEYGDNNKITGGGTDGYNRGQPQQFSEGRNRDVVQIPFDGTNLVWTLDGRTATANADSAPCDTEPAPTIEVAPVLECVATTDDGYIAHLGYDNRGDADVTIEYGDNNKITGGGTDGYNQGQPEQFSEGRNRDVIQIPFDGTNLVWTLDGRTATANADSAPCDTGTDPVVALVVDKNDFADAEVEPEFEVVLRVADRKLGSTFMSSTDGERDWGAPVFLVDGGTTTYTVEEPTIPEGFEPDVSTIGEFDLDDPANYLEADGPLQCFVPYRDVGPGEGGDFQAAKFKEMPDYVCVHTVVNEEVTTPPVTRTPNPDIELTKTVDPEEIEFVTGEAADDEFDVTYTFEVENTGNVALFNIELNDDHLGDLTDELRDAVGGSTLGTGQSVTIDVEHTLTEEEIAAGGVTNVAIVSGDRGGNTYSDEDDATVIVIEVAAETEVESGISIVKEVVDGASDDGTVTILGDGEADVSYSYTITNEGGDDLTILELDDDKIGDLTELLVEEHGEVLPVGESIEVVATQTVTPADFQGGLLVNVAEVTAVGGESGDEVDALDSASVSLEQVLPTTVVPEPEPAEPEAEPRDEVDVRGEVIEAPVQVEPADEDVQVMAEVQERQLPRTGVDSDTLLLLGLLLTILGATAITLSPNRRFE